MIFMLKSQKHRERMKKRIRVSSKQWHLHFDGENIGPVTTDVVKLFLKQHRVHFADYIWSTGHTKWHRIIDLDEFASLLPPYPSSPIPGGVVTPSAAPAAVEEVVVAKKVAAPKIQKAPKVVAEKQTEKVWPKVRRTTRIPCQGTVAIEGHDSFALINISEGGIFVKAKELLPIGADVKFSLEITSLSKKFVMTGVVIRHGVAEGEHGFAVEFTRLNPAHKRELVEFISQLRR